MDGDRLNRLKELLLEAADLPVGEREAFLDEACRDDPELRREAASLLASDGDSGETRTTVAAFSAPQGAADDAADPGSTSSLPDQIAGYHILSQLGEGGMGVVYLAEQIKPIRRRVALKVVKLGMDTRQVVARFEAERQALAMMDHPSIARVLDAGATEQGRPYFVMEHVPGIPITDFCDKHRLTTKERLRLFAQVCQAIHHAHQKGIIHRDIKPSNVLISYQEGKPVPKVIDFGVAKATSQRLTERTLFTELGQLIGTPEYMSPEQAEMTGLDVDTTTDVYSLGVLLYELLTGALPFDSKELRGAGLGEIHRKIREDEPPKPSTRVSTRGELTVDTAHRRRTTFGALCKQLRGDLDWIVMRAIEKDRTRRYPSASEFAADIGRYLEDQPVVAGPPSSAYRFRKFVRRHRVALAATTVIFLTIASAAVYSNTQRIAAERAQAEAQARAEELELVTEFQASMLSGIDAEAMGRALFGDLRDRVGKSLEADGVSVVGIDSVLAAFDRTLHRANATDVAIALVDEQVLNRAVETLEKEFSDQPLVRAALQQTIAIAYRKIGRYPPALPLQEAALDTRRRILGDDHLATLQSINSRGELLNSMGKPDEALVCFREAVAGCRRVLGNEDPETLHSLNNMGDLLHAQGKLDEALDYRREALAGHRRVLGDDHLETLVSINNMAVLLCSLGRFEEALVYHREALAGERRVLGDDNPETLTSINNMGFTLHQMGRLDEALACYREALEGRRRVLGDNHPRTLISIRSMGYILKSMGKLGEALVSYREALEGSRHALGDDHPQTLLSISHVGALLALMDKPDEALVYYDKAVAGLRRVLGGDHPNTLIMVSNMGSLLMSMGKLDEARGYFREALEGRRRAFGDDHPETLRSIITLGALLLDQGKPKEAIALLGPAEAAARGAFTGDGASPLGDFLTVLGRSRAATGMFAAAQTNLNEADTILREVPGAELIARENTLTGLVELYEAWHVAEPGGGYDRKAAEWRTKLAELSSG